MNKHIQVFCVTPTMADSWEDIADAAEAESNATTGSSSFNAGAASWTPSAGAASWTPSSFGGGATADTTPAPAKETTSLQSKQNAFLAKVGLSTATPAAPAAQLVSLSPGCRSSSGTRHRGGWCSAWRSNSASTRRSSAIETWRLGCGTRCSATAPIGPTIAATTCPT